MKSALWPIVIALLLALGAAYRGGEAAAGGDSEQSLGRVTEKVGATQIVLRNVMIFDPASGGMHGPQDVWIEGTRITEVGRTGEIGAVGDRGTGGGRAAHATEIDCTGKYAVAGLFDCHTHLSHLAAVSEDSLRAALAAFPLHGITQVRDVGGSIDVLSRMKEWVAAGEIAGPEIFYAGPMLEASPLTHGAMNEELPGFTVAVDTPEQADSVVSDLARRGASLVKTFGKFDRGVYARLCAQAAKCSLKVVHDPGEQLFNSIPIDVALDLGVTSIEHAKAPWPFVLRDDLRREHDNLLVAAAGMEARMGFIVKVSEMDTASVSRERLHKLGQEMIERGAYLCPTLEALKSVEEVSFREVRKQLGTEEIPDMIKDLIRKLIRAMETVSRFFVRELGGQGVKMLVGQDGFDAEGTFAEMSLLRQCGLSEAEIIKGATIYPAQWLGVDGRLGSIAAGKEASLLIVAANPLDDITSLASPSVIIHKGKILRH